MTWEDKKIESFAKTGGIGDVNSEAKGSGARYNAGKADFSLIPMWTLEDEARVWEYGKRKYAAWNWAKGMPWSVPFACLQRHLSAWQRGEEIDPESGLPHLAHVACNLRMLILYSKTYPEGDDRPPKHLMEAPAPVPVTIPAGSLGPIFAQKDENLITFPEVWPFPSQNPTS